MRTITALTLALLAGACRSGPAVSTGEGANPSIARGRLMAAAANGPVPLEIDSVPPVFAGGVTEVARMASRAGEWLGASFVPVPYGQGASSRRIVLRFEQPTGSAAEICRGTAPVGALPPSPPRLHAVFCDGPAAVADVTGTAAGTDLAEADRLITAAMDRLFPGRNGDYYYSSPGISLGVGVGSGGGWGLGGGLHF
jgi:hypothetical protein